MEINNDNTIDKNIDNENQIITEDQLSTSTIDDKIENRDNPENDIIDSETSFPSDIHTEIFDNDNFSYNNSSIDNSQENHIENLTSNFKAISMSTEIDNSSNYITITLITILQIMTKLVIKLIKERKIKLIQLLIKDKRKNTIQFSHH